MLTISFTITVPNFPPLLIYRSGEAKERASFVRMLSGMANQMTNEMFLKVGLEHNKSTNQHQLFHQLIVRN